MIVHKSGYNKDLIVAINERFPLAVRQTAGSAFPGKTFEARARAIWDYLHNSVTYRRDAPGVQVIQLPSRLLNDTRAGDCKSLALAAAALLTNSGVPGVFLRYASYGTDRTPSHVYAGARDEQGREIIVDPVFTSFDRQAPFQFKKDYIMQIESLSGVPAIRRDAAAVAVKRDPVVMAERILASGKVRPGGVLHNVIANYIMRARGGQFARYGVDQLNLYAKLLKQHANVKNAFVHSLVLDEMAMINSGRFTGNVVGRRDAATSQIAGACAEEFFAAEDIGKFSFKKIGKGIKKASKQAMNVVKQLSPKNILKGVKAVGLAVPRKAFLALVSLNARGLATDLKKTPQNELRKIWVDRFGGQMSVLNSAISNGARKRAIGDLNCNVRAVAGIGYVVDTGVGVSPASGADAAGGGAGTGVNLTQILAVATPILNIVLALIGKFSGKGDQDTKFPETAGKEGGEPAGWEDYVDQAVNMLETTGIIPSPRMSPDAVAVDESYPDDDAGGSSLAVNPWVALGLVGVAYAVLK